MKPATRCTRDWAAGRVKCLFAEHVTDALAALELSAVHGHLPSIVVVRWRQAPRIDSALPYVLERLAAAARTVWPAWFGEVWTSGDRGAERCAAHAASCCQVNRQWVLEAWRLAASRQLPLPHEYAKSVSARNLAQAISPDPLMILLAVEAEGLHSRTSRPHLDGMCRVGQWLANHTGGRIGLLLDRTMEGRAELQSVDYESWRWPEDVGGVPATEGAGWVAAVLSSSSEEGSIGGDSGATAAPAGLPYEDKLSLWPVIGRPHPASPGEQLMAAALREDPELCDAFEFNSPVPTVHGTRYIVDMLAARYRVIVEIDGFRHHSSRAAFRMDRQRDFELHSSGYLVLRLPHEDVLADPGRALAKIRCIVSFRGRLQEKGTSGGEVPPGPFEREHQLERNLGE